MDAADVATYTALIRLFADPDPTRGVCFAPTGGVELREIPTADFRLRAFIKANQREFAFQMLLELQPYVTPDVDTYTYLIDTFFLANEPEGVMNVFREMRSMALEPDAVTYYEVVNAFARDNQLARTTEAIKEIENRSSALGRWPSW